MLNTHSKYVKPPLLCQLAKSAPRVQTCLSSLSPTKYFKLELCIIPVQQKGMLFVLPAGACDTFMPNAHDTSH